MVFCTACGAAVDAGSRFCGSCGEPVVAATSPATAAPATTTGGTRPEDLTRVTGAVRDYAAHASTAEKEKKYGQQQWGLFETDSQRRRGITTDQSLQEIEDFAEHGVRPAPAPRPATGPGSAVRGTTSAASGGAAGGSGGLSPGRFGSAGSGAAGGGASSGATGAAGSGGGGGVRMERFGPGGDSGAAFFAQHQQRDAAKYKPGYRGQPPPQ